MVFCLGVSDLCPTLLAGDGAAVLGAMGSSPSEEEGRRKYDGAVFGVKVGVKVGVEKNPDASELGVEVEVGCCRADGKDGNEASKNMENGSLPDPSMPGAGLRKFKLGIIKFETAAILEVPVFCSASRGRLSAGRELPMSSSSNEKDGWSGAR